MTSACKYKNATKLHAVYRTVWAYSAYCLGVWGEKVEIKGIGLDTLTYYKLFIVTKSNKKHAIRACFLLYKYVGFNTKKVLSYGLFGFFDFSG